MVENFPASQQNVDGSTNWIMPVISCKYWASAFFFFAFCGILRAEKKEQKTYGC